MFSSLVYIYVCVSPPGFPFFFLIIHGKVMNVTLSMCMIEQESKEKKLMTIENESMRKKTTIKYRKQTNNKKNLHINEITEPYLIRIIKRTVAHN